jgi:undecaprenyl-phosphate galactose phosphotransferase/putative colanic acid biosynthesis UDP-glucose lipid carrier transferase
MAHILKSRGEVSEPASNGGSNYLSRFISFNNIGPLVSILDFALIVLASVAAGIIYHLVEFDQIGETSTFAVIGYGTGILFVLIMKSRGLYRPMALMSTANQLRGVTLAWIVVLLLLTSILFLLKIGAGFSRGSTIAFGILGLGLLLPFRAGIAALLSDAAEQGLLRGRRAILIGDHDELKSSFSARLFQQWGIQEVGRVELPSLQSTGAVLDKLDAAAVERAVAMAMSQYADEIVLALSWTDTRRRDLICGHLRILPLPVMLLPDRSVASILSKPLVEVGPVIAVQVQRAPLSRTELFCKRVFDLFFAIPALVLLSPLLLIVAVMIKLDSRGPVIFRQRRNGFGGRIFTIYKFRTMTVLEDGTAIRQATKRDARVTRVGRLLRATSIDELPQFYNVLRGDMSLVGPRPHAVAHDSEFSQLIANYAFRHHVKPGITGWAQVHGFRGETPQLETMQRRVEHDLWYINNWSLWLDLRILAQSCVEVMRQRNAY